MNNMIKKKHIVLSGIILALLFVGSIIYKINCESKRIINSLNTKAHYNLKNTNLNDGKFNGEYKNGNFKIVVLTTIENNKIKNIQILEHTKLLGYKAEKLTNEIINKETTDVDIVSSATLSSKALIKAVENSIEKSIVK